MMRSPDRTLSAPGFTWHVALNSPAEGLVLLELESPDADKRLRIVFGHADFLAFYRALGTVAVRIDDASPEHA